MTHDARLSPFQQWCVKSNLQRIHDEGLDPDEVVRTIRANGYPTVADAVERASKRKDNER